MPRKPDNEITPLRIVFAGLAVLTVCFSCFGQPADLVIVNGVVRTMDPARPMAECVAMSSGRIVAVGSDAEVRKLAGEKTRVIDAGGRLVLPGFNDSHVHFSGMGTQFSSIDLREATSPKDVAERIAYYTNFLPKGRWILGGGWNNESWTPETLPDRYLIDTVTPDNPVFLYHNDAKSALVNSIALKLAGISKASKNPEGGEIVRGPDGEPTGILKGAAMRLVQFLTRLPAEREKLLIAETATNYAAHYGVTSVQEVSADNGLAIYRELHRLGKLKTRIYDCVGLREWKTQPPADLRRDGGEILRGGCVKFFAEGETEEIPKLYGEILAADKAGLQVLMHAIGPRSNDVVLTVFERVIRANGRKDRRMRIEHAHGFRTGDLARFEKSGIIASVQPALFADYKGETTDLLRLIERSGVRMTFGSDASIIGVDPLAGIAAAVSGSQAVTVEEAVRFYTVEPAFAEFQESVKGTIAPGKYADLIILSQDIFSIPKADIMKTRVLTTIMNGEVAYESK